MGTMNMDEAVVAYQARVPLRDIVSRYNVAERTLHRELRRRGIPRRGKAARSGGGVPVYDAAGNLIADSISEAARRLGRPRNAVGGYRPGLYTPPPDEYADGLRLRPWPRCTAPGCTARAEIGGQCGEHARREWRRKMRLPTKGRAMTIDALERLRQAATPGIARVVKFDGEWCVVVEIDDDGPRDVIVATCSGRGNARLIAAAVNALPAFIRLARAVIEVRDAAQAMNAAPDREAYDEAHARWQRAVEEKREALRVVEEHDAPR